MRKLGIIDSDDEGVEISEEAGDQIHEKEEKVGGGGCYKKSSVCWGSLEFQVKRKVCRISEGIGNNMKYEILSYSKNFDDGGWQQEEVEFYRRPSFSYRFVQGSSCSCSLELDCLQLFY